MNSYEFKAYQLTKIDSSFAEDLRSFEKHDSQSSRFEENANNEWQKGYALERFDYLKMFPVRFRGKSGVLSERKKEIKKANLIVTLMVRKERGFVLGNSSVH